MTILIQSGDPGRVETPPFRQRRPRAAATTEFGAALTTLGIKQRSAAQWFHTSERNIRRWKSGTRKTPPAVAVVVRLMMAGKVTVADVELAAAISTRPNGPAKPKPPRKAAVPLASLAPPAQTNGGAAPTVVPVSARTNGGAKPAPPAPLEKASPESSSRLAAKTAALAAEAATLADPGVTTAEKVYRLLPRACRWCEGDPQRPDFRFCGRPAVTQPYCEAHRARAHLARSPASDIPQRGTCTLTPAGAN